MTDEASACTLLADEFRFNLSRGGDAPMIVAELRSARSAALKDPKVYTAFVLVLAQTALEEGVLYNALRDEALTVLDRQDSPPDVDFAHQPIDLLAAKLAAAPSAQPQKLARTHRLASAFGKLARRKP